jgi:hypothetical protein
MVNTISTSPKILVFTTGAAVSATLAPVHDSIHCGGPFQGGGKDKIDIQCPWVIRDGYLAYKDIYTSITNKNIQFPWLITYSVFLL